MNCSIRPVVQALESRILLSAVSWVGAASGTWDTASNWSNDAIPTISDDVTINTSPSIQVTLAATDVCNSLTSNNQIFEFNGQLDVATTLTLTNTFELDGGSLIGATVIGANELQATSSGIIPDVQNVTLNSDQTIADGAQLGFEGSLTLNNATLTIGSGAGGAATLATDTGTLGGTGTVAFAANSTGVITDTSNSSSVVNIGPNVLITGAHGTIQSTAVATTLNLQGTVTANTAADIITISGPNIVNSGTIQATNGGTINLEDDVGSGGVINENNGILNLDGQFFSIAGISRTGGTVNLGPTGVLNGQGSGTFTFDNTTGSWNLLGTVADAGLTFVGGNQLIPVGNTGTFTDDTLNSNMTIPDGTQLSVITGLALANNATITLASNAGGATLLFTSGTASLTGTGQVVFAGATPALDLIKTDSPLTIGSGITIAGPAGSITSTVSAPVTMLGTVEATSFGQAITISGDSTTFDGELAAIPGTIVVTGAYTQPAAGTVKIGVGSSGAGQIVSGTSAALGGTLAITLLGGFTPVQGTIFNILAAPAVSGTFGSVIGLSQAGVVFSDAFTANTVSLTTVTGAPPTGSSTTTTVLSSTNPSGLGAAVTFIATVANSAAVPTGSVTFLDGATPIGDGVLDSTGTATLSVSNLTLGSHTITASYPGDANNLASVSAPLSQDVIQPKSIGILDPAFANGGVASNSVGFTATSGLAVQSDGKSVIAGIRGSPGSEQFGVTRYNTDGSVDTGFGDNGVASAGFQGTINDSPSNIALLPNGQILVAGTATLASGGSEFAVALFDSDGTLDRTFGNGTGKVLTSFATGSTDVAHAVVAGLGGEFFVVGSSTASATGEDFAIAAYNADGTPATGFSGSGRELVDLHGGNDSANAAVVQPNGDLVVAGSTESPATDVTSIALGRLLPNGAPDSHFGTNGLVVTSLRGVDDEATSVALAAKGAIVVGGVSCTGSFAAGTLAADFAVLQYTSTGKADHTFGRGGSVITSFGEDAAVTKVIVQSDGEIIASGKTASGFGSGSLGIGLAEYTAKGTLDPAFNGGKTLITLTGQGATTSLQRPPAITPFDAQDMLRQEFEAFVSSAQGIIATTPGGNLAVAGNSGGFTEVGQLVAIGIDLAASLLAKLPASLKVGASVSITINVTEVGSTSASGVVTVELFLSGSSSVGAGDKQLFSHPQALKLKPRQAKSFKIKIKVPGHLTAGKYDFVAEVNTNSLTDLNPLNNIAFKGPVEIP